MGNCSIQEVIVHPEGGMQLSEGCILVDDSQRVVGKLPGMAVSIGDSIDDVLRRMNQFAKAYYGEDVVVEIVHHVATA